MKPHPVDDLDGTKWKFDRRKSASDHAREQGVSRQYVNRYQVQPLQPTFDEDGYPTEETLDVIRTWPIVSNFAVRDLLNYCGRAWNWHNMWAYQTGGRGTDRWISCSTGGWSGNESIISALQDNALFWAVCWLSSRRGGHYRFLTSPVKEGCK